jgi:hypothetical protein
MRGRGLSAPIRTLDAESLPQIGFLSLRQIPGMVAMVASAAARRFRQRLLAMMGCSSVVHPAIRTVRLGEHVVI